MAEEKNRLGGWLILVGIVVILSPLRIVIESLSLYPEMFLDESLAVLTTPESEFYSPFWAPIIYGEIIINVVLFLAWILIATLFFSKNRLFPKCFIGIALASLIIIFVDALAIKLVIPDEPVFTADTSKELVRSLIFCAIWIPYMLLSKRVQATFVR
jgi:hypothetical protein